MALNMGLTTSGTVTLADGETTRKARKSGEAHGTVQYRVASDAPWRKAPVKLAASFLSDAEAERLAALGSGRAQDHYRGDHAASKGEPVTEGHAQACRDHGHATWMVDGKDKGICPRCGEVTIPAKSAPLATGEVVSFTAGGHTRLGMVKRNDGEQIIVHEEGGMDYAVGADHVWRVPVDQPACAEGDGFIVAKRGTVTTRPSDGRRDAVCKYCGRLITRADGRGTIWHHTAPPTAPAFSDAGGRERLASESAAKSTAAVETKQARVVGRTRYADPANARRNFTALAEAATLGSVARKFWGRKAQQAMGQQVAANLAKA